MGLREGILVFVVAAALQCGAAVAQAPPAPPSSEQVAQVAFVAIEATEFERWLAQAAHSVFERPTELIAPKYEQCVEVQRQRRAARGWRKLPQRELRSRCALVHRTLRRTTMRFLIQAQWVEQEADAHGIDVSPQRVGRVFRSQRRKAFPDKKSYRRFLRKSGSDEMEVRYLVRLEILQRRLTRHATRDIEPVTRRDVARHRAAHPGRFAGMRARKARREAREQLLRGRQEEALRLFIADFRERSRANTRCAAEYMVSECGGRLPAS